MKSIFTLIALFISSIVLAQSEADLLKIQNALLHKSQGIVNNHARSGIGSSCFDAIQVFTQTNVFEGQTMNVDAEYGPDYGCLFTQPNPTWFKISVSSETQVSGIIYSTPSSDIDFILYETNLGGFGCNELTSQNIVDCSYSVMATETFDGFLLPNKEYYLLVTNFSNVPCTITLDFQDENIPFINSSEFVLTGQLYFDENLNCDFDFEESTVAGGYVKSEDLNILVPVQIDGSFSISLPFYSNQSFRYYPFLRIYDNIIKNCNNEIPSWTFSPDTNGEATQNVGIIGIDCAIPVVSNFSNLNRKCFSNTRFISYSNQGNLPLNNAYMKLTYDLNEILPIDFSVPYIQSGNDFIVQIGNLEPFQFGSFTITDSLRCENGIGSSVSVTAEILPNSPCLPPESTWDQSDLLVFSSCDNNTISFEVVNAGIGNMSSSTEAIVYENTTPVLNTTIQLLAGQQTVINVPALADKTYTLIVNETLGHPFNQTAWASAECYSGEVFFGIPPFLMPQDQQPNIDQDIKLVVGAYNPNDKQAVPYGLGIEKAILKTDELEYTIRFQNTGNDTVFKVVVIDQLSEFLDPSTFQMIGASHPYNFVLRNNVLTVKFQNIQLPDSSNNPAGSQGFFIFKIKLAEIPFSNYFVDNKAYIYFDFNLPVHTNICRRQVQPQLALSNGDFKDIQNEIKFYPNPVRDILSIQNDNSFPSFYEINDIQGRLIEQGTLTSGENKLNLEHLKQGMYLITVHNRFTKFTKRIAKN